MNLKRTQRLELFFITEKHMLLNLWLKRWNRGLEHLECYCGPWAVCKECTHSGMRAHTSKHELRELEEVTSASEHLTATRLGACAQSLYFPMKKNEKKWRERERETERERERESKVWLLTTHTYTYLTSSSYVFRFLRTGRRIKLNDLDGRNQKDKTRSSWQNT